MNLLKALALTLAIGSLTLAQQEMRADLQYPAGTPLKNTYFGIGFTVPGGWVAQFAEENGVQVLALSNAEGYTAVLIFQHGLSAAAYLKGLSEPFPLGEVAFEPLAPAKQQGNLVTVYAQEPTNGIEAQLGALVGPQGSSVLIWVGGTAGSADGVGAGFKQIQGAVRFTAPLAVQGDANLRQTWQNRLTGRLLSSSSTSTSGSQNGFGSSSSETRLLLCRSGQYQMQSQSLASVSAGDLSSTSQDSSNSAGTWKVEFVSPAGAILTLTEKAQQRRVNLRMVGNNLLLDGRAVSLGAGGC